MLYRALRQAMMARRVLLILDGMDEGGKATAAIEKHVSEVLAPQGFVLLVTSRGKPMSWRPPPSRPSADDEDDVEVAEGGSTGGSLLERMHSELATPAVDREYDYHHLSLDPLDEAQQRAAVEMRLGEKRAPLLIPYVESMPLEVYRAEASERRVTSSAICISMLISVFDLYLYTSSTGESGVHEMPPNFVELLHIAMNAVLKAVATGKRAQKAASKIAASKMGLGFRKGRAAVAARLGLSQGGVVGDEAGSGGDGGGGGDSKGGGTEGSGSKPVQEAGESGTRKLFPSLTPALRAMFFEPHSAEQRVLTEAHIEAAISHVGPAHAHAVHAIVGMVRKEAMPMLSLLQAEPMQLQSSHLTIQEYYVAKAVCEEERELPVPPWQLSSWWQHFLTLGCSMGVPFQRGLLQGIQHGDRTAAPAAVGRLEASTHLGEGVPRETLDLKDGQLGGDRPTSLFAVTMLMQQISSLDLSANSLTSEEAIVISEALRGNTTLTSVSVDDHPSPAYGDDPRIPPGGCVGVGRSSLIQGVVMAVTLLGLQPVLDANGQHIIISSSLPVKELRGDTATPTIDLSYKGLREASAVIIAGLLTSNPHTWQLDLNHNALGPEGVQRLTPSVEQHSSLSELRLRSNLLRAEGAAIVANMLRGNRTITTVDLASNSLGSEGAQRLAEVLRFNGTLASLDLAGNGICDSGVMDGTSSMECGSTRRAQRRASRLSQKPSHSLPSVRTHTFLRLSLPHAHQTFAPP